MSSFGTRLRKARLARGYTQEQLGLEVEVTKATVSSWESDRMVPQFQKLESLRNSLGVDLDYLVCNSVATARHATLKLGVREAMPGYNGGSEQWLSPREVSLVTAWRALPVDRQDAMILMMRPHRETTPSKQLEKSSR